jgi:hypothetical protein
MNVFFKFLSEIRTPWMINSAGKKDWMLVFAAIGLFVSCLSLLISTIESVTVGSTTISFEKPDTTLVLGILSSTLGAYVIRRHKKDHIDHVETLEKIKQEPAEGE